MRRLFIAALIVVFGVAPAYAGPLHDAANDGDTERARRLIAEGEEINEIDKRAGTPLHRAALKGHLEAAELLVAAGAKMNAKAGSLKWTPLYMAALGGKEGVAALLIANGAEIDARGVAGNTPLHAAAGRGHGAVVELLVANGADVNATNNNGDAPIHSAGESDNFDVVDLLYALGVSAPPVEPVSGLLKSASATEGASVFMSRCAGCHTIEKGGRHKIGPNIWGFLERERASLETFDYSGAFARLGGMWTYEDVNALLANPKDFAPGTTMWAAEFEGEPDVAVRANLIAYLRENSDNPPPLPTD